MNLTRKQFLRGTTAAAVGVLSGCAAPLGTQRSYLTGLVPEGAEIEPDAFWTDVMFQGVRDQSLGPPLAARIYAMGHLAGFVAVNGIEGGYHHPYPEIGKAPRGACSKAAYAAATARAAAEGLQTPTKLDLQRYLSQLSESGDSVDAGVRWGTHVGKIVQKDRTVDGGNVERVGFYFDKEYRPRKTIDSWSSTGPFYETEIGPRFGTYDRGLFPNLGNMKPYAIRSKTQFAAPPFLDVRSKEFAEQFEEVYHYGGSRSSIRTEDQKEIAFFWEDGPRGGTVPAAWLHIGLRLTQKRPYTLIQRAQLLAQMSCAMADAGMSAWHSKYRYDIIRPETAIRHAGEKLGNPDPRVKRDPNWKTLIPTPPFPAYVSGHSAFSGAGAEALRRFFGTDQMSFSVEAIDLVNWPKQLRGAERSYTNFTTVENENGMSRIYGGVHWQHDNQQGLSMGRSIASYVSRNFLHPV